MRPGAGHAFPVGATVVTCTATDAYGNAATSAFTVTVGGPGAPPPAPPARATPVPPAGDTRADTAAPRLRRLRAEARAKRAARIRFRLCEAARVTLTLRRKGASGR